MAVKVARAAVRNDPQKAALLARFEEMRERTLALAEPVSPADLAKVHEPTMGPVNWDLGHIPNFETFWLVHGIHGKAAQDEHYDAKYDAEEQPRPTRADLDLLDLPGARVYMEEARARMLDVLAEVDLVGGDRLVKDGFVYEMILEHEAQHQENILITLQLIPGRYTPGIRVPKPAPQTKVTGMVDVPGGPFELGAAQTPGVYDNEAPPHTVDVPAFRIDAAPVTNGDFLRFMAAGGYDDEAFWHDDGWDLRLINKWQHPKYWSQTNDGAWTLREMDRTVPLPLDQPVIHVSWYEADAYARWAGKRLPTEAEWEKAATWDPVTGTKRRQPWGDEPWTPERANLDQTLFGPAPVGAYPRGASAVGCHQMMGDAWEWTSSDFSAYPGFAAYPYDGYSKPFFDRGFKVLRGGAWATRPLVARATFRNWHQPDHQQIFAGFRCAADGGA